MEVERIARKLEPLRPEEVKNWRRARDMVDPDVREMLDKQLFCLAHRVLGDFRSKTLLSLPPENKAKRAIHLGTILYEKEKWPVGISPGELLQNMAIFGRSGAGKTNLVFHLIEQLVEKGIPFLFLDWKRTARHLIPRLQKKINVYTPGRDLSPFPFNPFVPPPGLEPRVYVNQVVDVLAEAFTLGDGVRNVLQKAISTCYDAGNRCPTPRDVLSEVEKQPQTGRAGGWRVSAVRALESLDFFNLSAKDKVSQEELAQHLLKGNTVIELDSLSHNSKRFLLPLLCLWLYYVRLGAKEREQLRLVVVVEEAHHVLHKNEQKAKESVMEMLLRQCREIGIGMIIVDQHPHLVSSAALGNTYTSVCLNLKDPTDINRAAGLSLVEDSDKRCFTQLPVGQGVVKLQDRWRQPFLVKFPHIAVDKGSVTDEVLARYLRGNTPGSGWKKSNLGDLGRVRQIPGWEEGLNEGELAFLEDVVSHLDDGVRQRYVRLGLSAHTGTKTKRALVRDGWLEEEVVPVGNSRKSLLRLTPKAKEQLGLDASGNSPKKESLAHEYWKRYYARLYQRKGYKTQIEAPRIGGRVDILAENDGQRIGIEIETGKSDVVQNVRNCLRSGFETVLVVATDAKALEKAERELARAGLVVTMVTGRVEAVLAG